MNPDPSLEPEKMPFRSFSHSLIGARTRNEDVVATFALGQDQFAILCDGLGGYPDGDWASAQFASAVQEAVTRHIPADDLAPEQALQDWLQRAWQTFCTAREQQQRHEQAQTTFALAWLSGEFTLLAHAGDSRIYCLDSQQLHWRTRDHNLYELGVLNGDIDPLQVPQPHGQHALLYRSVSSQKPLKPTLTRHAALVPGQTVVLCSDGAWLYLTDADWLTLADRRETDARLLRCLETAVQRGGEKADNASAIAIIKTG